MNTYVCGVSIYPVGDYYFFRSGVFIKDDQVFFALLLFGEHICSYSTTEKYIQNEEMWAR